MIDGSLSSCIAGFHQSFRFSQSFGPRRSCVGTGPAFAATGVGSRDAACRRAPEIVIDRFDARPAQRRQTIAHRILQGAALAIVENLMGGGPPYIQDRLALQMVRPDLL